MFSLRLNDTALTLPADARIRVVLSCPLFDRDRILRTFSYPFGLPLTAQNQRALRHAHRFDAGSAWGAQECQLWISGGQYERGELVSLGSDDTAIDAVFRNLPVTVVEDLGNLKINELLETIAIPETGPDAEVVLTITTPPFAYDITIGGINYVLGIGGSSGMSTADVGVYFRDLINADYPGMASSNTTQLILDSAMVNDHNVDWSVMTGFTIATYITPGEAAQQNFLNYVESVVGTPVDSHAWPVVEWAGLYEGKNSLYEGTVNPVFDGQGLENVENADETKFKYTYIPMVRVPYILEKIRAAAGIGYLDGYVNNADFAALLVLNNLTCDKSYYDYYEDEQNKYLNGFTQSINLNNHVPKMTALDFLKKLAAGLNLIIEYKDGGLWLTKSLDLVSAAAANYSEYVQPGRYNFQIAKPEGVTLKYPDNDKEGYSVVGQLEDYVLGDGGKEQVLPFGTMYVNNGFLLDHGTYRCPITQQSGKSPIFGANATDMALSLVFYRGIKQTSEAEDYAYATHDELDTDEATVIGGLSLELDGTYGLVAQNFGSMLGYGDLSEIDVVAIVPESELYRLKKWTNARIYFYHPNGPVTMVLKSVEFEVGGRETGGWVEARVRGIKE